MGAQVSSLMSGERRCLRSASYLCYCAVESWQHFDSRQTDSLSMLGWVVFIVGARHTHTHTHTYTHTHTHADAHKHHRKHVSTDGTSEVLIKVGAKTLLESRSEEHT